MYISFYCFVFQVLESIVSTMVLRALIHMPNVTRENVPVELATIGNMEFVVSLEHASLYFLKEEK